MTYERIYRMDSSLMSILRIHAQKAQNFVLVKNLTDTPSQVDSFYATCAVLSMRLDDDTINDKSA